MSLPEVTLENKYSALLTLIREQQSVAVAFSGGVDSSFLCYAAFEALGNKALAVTVVSPMLPQSELQGAKALAAQVGLAHYLIENPHIEDEVAVNTKNRCYHCKKLEFSGIQKEAQRWGAKVVLDGSNLDDLDDYRPGLKALQELQILSPLRAVGLRKAEIRELSRQLGLPTWNKPAFACLASRIPYGERIDHPKLTRIEKSEDWLRAFGFRQFRVRSHGDIARLEVAPGERSLFFNETALDEISRALKSFGFLFVTFELEGYVMGSLNRTSRSSPSSRGSTDENSTF